VQNHSEILKKNILELKAKGIAFYSRKTVQKRGITIMLE